MKFIVEKINNSGSKYFALEAENVLEARMIVARDILEDDYSWINFSNDNDVNLVDITNLEQYDVHIRK